MNRHITTGKPCDDEGRVCLPKKGILLHQGNPWFIHQRNLSSTVRSGDRASHSRGAETDLNISLNRIGRFF